MAQTTPTPMWRLANNAVKGGIEAFIAQRRAENMSWQDIALELYLATKGEIKVTPVTVRKWGLSAEDAAA